MPTMPVLQLDSVGQDWQDFVISLSVPVLLVILAGAALVGAYLGEKAVMAALRRWAKRTKVTFDDIIVASVHPSLLVFFFIGIVWIGIQFIPLAMDAGTSNIVDRASVILMLVALAVLFARLFKGFLQIPAQKDGRWQPVSTVGSRIVSAVIYIVAFLTILASLNVEITPLLTTLGVATLAVGLALQDTLANFFAGIWIQSGRALRPGNFVRLEGEKLDGFIVDVGWRTTHIRTLPGNMVVVPNSVIAKAVVTDFSLPEPKMGTNITVVVGFEHDPDTIVPMLVEEAKAAAKEIPYILEDPPPFARFNRVVDNGWEFWMSFWVPVYYDQWNAQGHVLNRIRKRFLKEGIRIPYPLRETIQVPHERADLHHSVVAHHIEPNGDDQKSRAADEARPAERGLA
jgi:small-conductance mechanosensitive channel